MSPILPPFNLPTSVLLLITDELSSPADVLLHKSLHQHIKHTHHRAVVLSVSESLARWKAVAARSNVNVDNGSVEFVDVVQHGLRPVFDKVREWMKKMKMKGDGSELVILDDVSTLEWIGFEVLDVVRFVRALRGVCCIEANATLIVRHHRISNDAVGHDDLFAHLYQMCAYHLEVRGLASGRSGSVSGEIALNAGPGTVPTKDGVGLIPRSCAMQYKLTDTGAIFFDKGTGGAVL